MTALNQDLVPRAWAQGWPRNSRRPAAGTIATGKVCYQTSMCMSVDGVAQPCLSGAAMQAVCKSDAGGDANSGLFISARTTGVRVALTSGSAESIAITYGTTTDIAVTYNNGTSTPNSLCAFIRAHAEADRLLRVAPSGTGAGTSLVAVLIANGAVPCITMLGVPNSSADNSTGGSPMPVPPSYTFDVGLFGAQPDASAVPLLNGTAIVLDDNTFSATSDPLAFQVPIRLIDGHGLYFGDISEAR